MVEISMNIFKAKRMWYKAENTHPLPSEDRGYTACVRILSKLTQWKLTQPSCWRLVLPPTAGADPLKEWKEWAARVTTKLNHRLPGNWKTSRGIKKRKKALWRLYQ